MAGEFKPGALVMLLRSANPTTKKYVGTVRTLGIPSLFYKDAWRFDPNLVDPADGLTVCWDQCDMRLIDPGTGADESLTWASRPAETVVPVGEAIV